MKLITTINNVEYIANTSLAKNIGITLSPNEKQPNHFGSPICESNPLQTEEFIGKVSEGGSCNVNVLKIIPHCNGTHTESISHIVKKMFPVFSVIKESIFPSILISIEPILAKDTDEKYIPSLDDNNQVICRWQLEKSLAEYSDEQLSGLVIRTLPNDESKKITTYDTKNYPVYLTNDAMKYIVARKIKHLLVDFPSVDKMYDDGLLSNHRLFWNVKPNSIKHHDNSWINKTITEMIFVSPTIKDGFYLCNLNAPAIKTDAVPTNPILYPLTRRQ